MSDNANLIARLQSAYEARRGTYPLLAQAAAALKDADEKLARVRQFAEDPSNLDDHWGTLIDPAKVLEALDGKPDQGDASDQLYPTPEENFWDDRTTPLSYGQQDSERDLEARRQIAEKCWDEGVDAALDERFRYGGIVNPYRKK